MGQELWETGTSTSWELSLGYELEAYLPRVSGFSVAKVAGNFQCPGQALTQSAKVDNRIVSHINSKSLLKNWLND